jgi:hypothetical protein
LMEIALIINCGISDVYLDEDSPEFALKTRLIG